MLPHHLTPDKPEQKNKTKRHLTQSRKNAKEILYLGLNTNDLAFLCELGDSLRSAYCWLREIFLPCCYA
jgi:hypothetical protein